MARRILAQLRGEAGADRFEGESLQFHEKLREAFRLLAMTEPNRCVLIDADAPRMTVFERIWKVVSDRLDPATAPVSLENVAS